MNFLRISHKRQLLLIALIMIPVFAVLFVRVGYLMIYRSEYYSEKADDLHERERTIKAARGVIYDANGTEIASNRTVCTISVVHNQVKQPDEVIAMLSAELGIDEAKIKGLVEKRSSREIIKTNVDKKTGDKIRNYGYEGVKVDEDYKRYYPYGSMASKVLGFTGADNQGIIGLEVEYEDVLKGTNGKLLTLTDAAGIEIDDAAEKRIEPVAGNNLKLSLDVNIQKYAEQAALKVMEKKNAKRVSVIIMNPQNGELLAMVNCPEFDLNAPYKLSDSIEKPLSGKEYSDALNNMWRNTCINDTYEPGSTFKIITMSAALDAGVVGLNDTFHCGGFRVVEDRRIHCHKVIGHGTETFVQGAMNSCNPVFIDVGLRLGVDRFYEYFNRFGLLSKTGIDLPGEASTIMHKKENMGEVELATVSFGQSFQITPIQLVTTAASLVNGGRRVTPHFGVEVMSSDGESITKLEYKTTGGIISEETSKTVRYILEKVVSEGSGSKAYIEGYSIGGKTATSEKLPRKTGRYISSFLGFVPADNPQVIALITIDEPEGVYYGGTIAAPVIKEIYENILPYLEIEKTEGKLSGEEE
ncbi:MAG: peptidoglycan glycosyltransferase [Lachnospiraceae bacterium]|nr:peptidoglycan glycosyltransferase [Lachnospiraceae bacterium]